MSYVRPVKQQELVDFLESIDYNRRDAHELAEILRERYDVITTSASP